MNFCYRDFSVFSGSRFLLVLSVPDFSLSFWFQISAFSADSEFCIFCRFRVLYFFCLENSSFLPAHSSVSPCSHFSERIFSVLEKLSEKNKQGLRKYQPLLSSKGQKVRDLKLFFSSGGTNQMWLDLRAGV